MSAHRKANTLIYIYIYILVYKYVHTYINEHIHDDELEVTRNRENLVYFTLGRHECTSGLSDERTKVQCVCGVCVTSVCVMNDAQEMHCSFSFDHASQKWLVLGQFNETYGGRVFFFSLQKPKQLLVFFPGV